MKRESCVRLHIIAQPLLVLLLAVAAGAGMVSSYYMGEKPLARRPGETVQQVQERQARPGLLEPLAFPWPATFHNARYHLTAEPGRILVTAEFAVTADSHTFAALPLKGIAISGVALDRRPADLLPSAERILVRVPPGRHEVRVWGALAVQRGRSGAFTEWTPGFPGAIVPASTTRIEGGVALAGTWVTGAEPMRISLATRAGRTAGGSWTVDARHSFRISASRTSCLTEIAYEAFGIAPDTFAVRLPKGFAASHLEGDAQEAEVTERCVVVVPTAEAGRFIIRSEAVNESGALDLSGLRIDGAGRTAIALALCPADDVTTAISDIAGVTSEGDTWRITADAYRFAIALRRSERTRLAESYISWADLDITLPDRDNSYCRLRLHLAGKPASYLGLSLPEGSELLSVLAGGNAIAPMKSGSAYRLAIMQCTGIVEVIFCNREAAAGIWRGREIPLPRFDLPVSQYNLTAWIPADQRLLGSIGPWKFDGMGPLLPFLCEQLTYLFIFLVKWGGIPVLVVVLAAMILSPKKLIKPVMAIKQQAVFLVLLAVGLGIIVTGIFGMPEHERNMLVGDRVVSTTDDHETCLEQYVVPPAPTAEAPEGEPAAAPAAPVPQQPAAGERETRDGGLSIAMEIPLSGNRYRFERVDPDDQSPLRLWTMANSWARALMLLGGLTAGIVLLVRPAAAVCWLLASGLAGFVIPGMFFAALFGAGLAAAGTLAIDRIKQLRKAGVWS